MTIRKATCNKDIDVAVQIISSLKHVPCHDSQMTNTCNIYSFQPYAYDQSIQSGWKNKLINWDLKTTQKWWYDNSYKMTTHRKVMQSTCNIVSGCFLLSKCHIITFCKKGNLSLFDVCLILKKEERSFISSNILTNVSSVFGPLI